MRDIDAGFTALAIVVGLAGVIAILGPMWAELKQRKSSDKGGPDE